MWHIIGVVDVDRGQRSYLRHGGEEGPDRVFLFVSQVLLIRVEDRCVIIVLVNALFEKLPTD
jgi:hypothetical protein